MKLISHTYRATDIGVTFTVHCPVQLTERQVIRAIRMHWAAMKKAGRTTAKKAGAAEFVVPAGNADIP